MEFLPLFLPVSDEVWNDPESQLKCMHITFDLDKGKVKPHGDFLSGTNCQHHDLGNGVQDIDSLQKNDRL